MVDKKVKKWVKEQQALGYSPKEIDDFLIEQGYPPDVADEATGVVSEPKAKPEPEPEAETEPELESEPEDAGKGKLKRFGKPGFLTKFKSFRKPKFLENRKALPFIIIGAVLLIIIVAVIISSLSKPGPETPDGLPPDEGTEPLPDNGTEPPPEGGTEPLPDNGTGPTPEDPNECDAEGESAACDDGNSSTYDHCFDNTTSGLRQCAHIYEPIESFDLEKARNLTIDGSDLLDFCDKENINNAEAYPNWTPGQVEIVNNEPPKACAVYVDRWCKGWFVGCIVNQTRKIVYMSAQKIPFEDSYVVSEHQIVELPVEEESAE